MNALLGKKVIMLCWSKDQVDTTVKEIAKEICRLVDDACLDGVLVEIDETGPRISVNGGCVEVRYIDVLGEVKAESRILDEMRASKMRNIGEQAQMGNERLG